MATSIIANPRPPFLVQTYTCGTGTIYPITDSDHSARKTITRSNLGISAPSGYVMGGMKSFKAYDGNITVLTANPNASGDVLYLLNFTSWNISTTAQVTIVWIREDMAEAG